MLWWNWSLFKIYQSRVIKMNNKTEFPGSNFCHRMPLFCSSDPPGSISWKCEMRIHMSSWFVSLCATGFVEDNTSEIVTVADDCVNTVT